MKKKYTQKNMSRQILSLSKGFTLVETLVAISIFTVSLLGIMSLIAGSISNTSYAKQKIAATYLAQEGIEYARNMRDSSVFNNPTNRQTGWDVFLNYDDSIITPSAPTDTSFSRTVVKNNISTDEVEIISEVSWNQGSGVHSVRFSENLYNWIE